MLDLGIPYRVEELVPHRGPLCLLDSIDAYGENWLRASVTTRPATAFAAEAGIPGWLGIEYMAQTAAAFGGIEQVQRAERPSIGLLIGSRYYRSMVDLIPFGTRLTVLASLALRDAEDFAAYDCTLDAGEVRIAECTLKAYRPQDLTPYLAEHFRGANGG